MKKPKQKTKKRKRSPKKRPTGPKEAQAVQVEAKGESEKPVKVRPERHGSRRTPEAKGGGERSPLKYVGKAGQFLRESRTELKKVKWPTRKELLTSTAVVIVLTLFIAFFLGLVDFGLIKIIRRLIG